MRVIEDQALVMSQNVGWKAGSAVRWAMGKFPDAVCATALAHKQGFLSME
jgi:hypothetical protein